MATAHGNGGVLWLVVCLACLSSVDSARLLMMPSNTNSHAMYFTCIAEGLIKHGHEIYMLLSPNFDPPKYVKESGITILRYNETIPEPFHDEDAEKAVDEFVQLSLQYDLDTIMGFRFIPEKFITFVHNMLGDNEMLATLKNLQLDLVVLDGLPFDRFGVIIPYRLGVNHVTVTTQYDPWEYRIPALPSFVPFPMATGYTERMTFFQRLWNLVRLTDWAFSPRTPTMDNKLVEMHAPEKPYRAISDLSRKSLLWLVNTDNALDYPRPTMPNVIYTGGLTTKPAKALPPDLKNILDSAKDGAILVSFGSIAKNLPPETTENLWKAFKNVKYTILWKYNGRKFTDLPSNIHVREWIPQNDILGHPNIKLFITHSGNNGQFEALYHGVPMIGYYMFGEQHYNAKRMEYKGFGIHMKLKTFTADELVTNIEEIFNNPSYKKNIQKASEIYRSSPVHPRDRAIYWIEHVMTFGGDHLHSHAVDMPWYQYAMLDILACLVVTLLIAFLILKKLTICLCSCFAGKSKSKME